MVKQFYLPPKWEPLTGATTPDQCNGNEKVPSIGQNSSPGTSPLNDFSSGHLLGREVPFA